VALGDLVHGRGVRWRGCLGGGGPSDDRGRYRRRGRAVQLGLGVDQRLHAAAAPVGGDHVQNGLAELRVALERGGDVVRGQPADGLKVLKEGRGEIEISGGREQRAELGRRSKIWSVSSVLHADVLPAKMVGAVR